MRRTWKLTVTVPLLLTLGCGPTQEDIDTRIDEAVGEALETMTEGPVSASSVQPEPSESIPPGQVDPAEVTAMDIGQYLLDNLDGIDASMPSRYFSPKGCEPLEAGSLLYGNADPDCNRSVTLGPLTVVEYATVEYARELAEGAEQRREENDPLTGNLGPRYREDRFMVRWDDCGAEPPLSYPCQDALADGTAAESGRLLREFLGV